MYSRAFNPPEDQSYFLFGPRGTGKSWLVKQLYAQAPYFDLLKAGTCNRLMAAPERLADEIAADYRGWVVIDEIQKVPALLDEVHRLIETRPLRFVLTGSSVRSLRRSGTNLLAGRALTMGLHPLTARELGKDFDLGRALQYGQLPRAWQLRQPKGFLASYVNTYLQEEIRQEALTRNLPAFNRFLQVAAFSQAQPLNISAVARECGVNRKAVNGWFGILRDTLIARELPVFARRAKRKLLTSVKFFFFDSGVFRALRPRGPLDSDSELAGAALETLVMQNLMAENDYQDWGYDFHHWRTPEGAEVDLVLYGERGLKAIEVKSSFRLPDRAALRGLRLFQKDYPQADLLLLYTGSEVVHDKGVDLVPVSDFLRQPDRWL